MRFKTLPIFTLATYRMGSNFSIRVTPNINLITVGLNDYVKNTKILASILGRLSLKKSQIMI